MENEILVKDELQCCKKKNNIAILASKELSMNKIYNNQIRYMNVFKVEVNIIKNKTLITDFLNKNSISTIIISSEIFNNANFNECEFISSLLDIEDIGVKIVLLIVSNPIFIDDIAYVGGIDAQYINFIKRIERIVLRNKENLIVKCSTYYGYSIEQKDFVRWVIEDGSEEILQLDNIVKLDPIIIEDISSYIAENIVDGNGIHYLSSSINCTLYEFAKKVCNLFDKKDNDDNINSDLILKNNEKDEKSDFTQIANKFEKGINTVREQMKCSFEIIYKGNPLIKKNNMTIAEYRLELGRRLIKSIPDDVVEKIDYVVPVPNTGTFYALGLAEETKVTYMQALNKVSSDKRSFSIDDIGMRKYVLETNILPIKKLIKGKVLAIVDEAIFTGVTLKVVCNMLKDCGVKAIYLCIPTPGLCSNCKYNVYPYKDMLKEKIGVGQLKEFFGVEDIFFQQKTEFYECLEQMGGSCVECFIDKK